MLLRPADPNGDILPVLSSAGMLSGPEAIARLVQCQLSLLQGEWWENPEDGFSILEVLRESRVTEEDAASVSSLITAYIRETPGVRDAENVRFSAEGRKFLYSCDVITEEGRAEIFYEAGI